RWLAIQTFAALAVVCSVVFYLTNLNLQSRQEALIQQKMAVVQHLVEENAANGDIKRLRHKLDDFFYGRPDFSLILDISGEKVFYGKPLSEDDGDKTRQLPFDVTVPERLNGSVSAVLVIDTTADARLRTFLAWTLFACALAGAIIVSAIG